ncbi:MAG: serine hydrolase [Nonlabens sp.]
MKNRILLAFALLLLSLFVANAQTNKQSENLEKLFDYCYENEIFNGAVLIKKDGDVLLNKAYGFSDISQTNDLKTSSSFYLASLSKQFTAFAIALLENDGKLKYDDLVRKHLPNFPYADMKISHLLHHTSGIPDYQKLLNKQRNQLIARYEKTGKKVTNTEVANIIAKLKLPLDFEPSTNFKYSNTGYVYLALIIEKINGLTFTEFLKNRIFLPLEMTSSGVISDKNNTSLVPAFKTNLYGKNVVNTIPNFFGVYGDGGVYSGTADLGKWDEALRNHTLLNEDKLQALFKTPTINGKESPYALGWFVRTLPFNGSKAVTHSGVFVGYTNSMFRELNSETTSIVLSNNSHSANAEINQAVIRILYDVPFEFPKIPASKIISEIILTKGIQDAQDFYDEESSNNKYAFSETEMNHLGYDLIKIDKMEEAIAIFKMNVKMNPNSSNVYDSLGEAYLKSGDNEKALKNYRTAFAKDPKNLNAERIIQELSNPKNK